MLFQLISAKTAWRAHQRLSAAAKVHRHRRLKKLPQSLVLECVALWSHEWVQPPYYPSRLEPQSRKALNGTRSSCKSPRQAGEPLTAILCSIIGCQLVQTCHALKPRAKWPEPERY